MDKHRLAIFGVASTLAFHIFTNLDRIAKVFGIINIPKDTRETMSVLSSFPDYLSIGVLVIGAACVVYLYLEHLAAISRHFWNPKLDLFTVGLIGMVAFGAIAGLGLYRQSATATPKQVEKNPLVKNEAGPPIEWRFDKPVTILFSSRRPGEAVRIEAIQIFATNKSDLALKNVKASISADLKEGNFAMRVNPHGTFVPPDQSASLIPPRADFDLMMTVPPNGGLSAEDFLSQYGELKFSFEYEQQGSHSTYGETFPLSYLEDQISFIEEKTKEQRRGLPPSNKKSKGDDASPREKASGPTSAGINLASIGLKAPDGITITDEVTIKSLSIGYLNICNSDGKETLFRRSWSAFPSGNKIQKQFSHHQFYVAIENKSDSKTLRNARLVAKSIGDIGGRILNDPFLCDGNQTGSVDIPPGGAEYFLIGGGYDGSDAGIFHLKIVTPEQYDNILASVEAQQHVGFTLQTAKGGYPLLKNDGYKIEITAYADDTASVNAKLIINTRSRIEVWLSGADHA